MEDLNKLIEALNKAVESHKLLERIYSEIDPYGDTVKFSPQLLKDLLYYFKFDDSE